MKALTLILILQLLCLTNCYSCKDIANVRIDTLQNRSIKTSDLIFLGKLIRTDTLKETLVYKILEIFKGEIAQDTVEIKWEKHTNINTFDYSLWIVYSNKSSDSSIILNSNGLSRSIDHPDYIWFYSIPPPPPLKLNANLILRNNMQWIHIRFNALKDWYVELEMLREYRKEHSVLSGNNNFDFKIYFYISIILNLICIVLIVLVILKSLLSGKKKNRVS